MSGKKVLLIDDNRQITNLLKDVLKMKGYQSFISENRDEALKLYNDNDFDIVICDLKLGEQTDGLSLITELKSVKDSVFILSSGFSNPLDKETMEQLGIKGFLSKPFAFNDLFKMLGD